MLFADARLADVPQPVAPVVPRAEQYQASAGVDARIASPTSAERPPTIVNAVRIALMVPSEIFTTICSLCVLLRWSLTESKKPALRPGHSGGDRSTARYPKRAAVSRARWRSSLDRHDLRDGALARLILQRSSQ